VHIVGQQTKFTKAAMRNSRWDKGIHDKYYALPDANLNYMNTHGPVERTQRENAASTHLYVGALLYTVAIRR
jgi:hypothetical protein